ncbi:MAG TPA: SurA N-terminal domain-containing protein [Terriglobales bacterium]|nr:SurA N-terminal domain-containing protein [Terriglobales bacterium]
MNGNLRLAGKATAALLLTSALLLLVSLSACKGKQGSGDVMAKVNGRKILRSEVDKYYNAQVANSPQKPTSEQAESLRLSILRELIDNEILMQRAEKLGLLATDEEVQQKLNELKAPYTQEEFDARLKQQNRTLEDLKQDLRRSLTIDKVINREITSKIDIKDGDISGYYNAHKPEFNLIEPQYHLAQIFVTSQPGPVRNRKNSKAQNEAEAKRKIQMIENRLDSGEDFATVAMDYSEDTETAANGGDLGLIPESGLKQTDPVTREAVLRLKPGQYSSIVAVTNPATKQPGAYRIVKLLKKEPAGQRDLNDPRVQQAIRDELRNRREQLLKAAYYDVLRDEADVENYLALNILKNTPEKK